MTNQPALNPDALGRVFATAMMEVLDAEKLMPGKRLVHVNDMQEVLNRLEKNILAVAQPVPDETALANLIAWKRLPWQATRFIQLDANAAHAVIKLLKPHLSVAQPVVNSTEELDALPVGTVIIDKYGDAGLIDREGTVEKYVQYTETAPLSIGFVAKHYLPARVLCRPEVNDA